MISLSVVFENEYVDASLINTILLQEANSLKYYFKL